MKNIKFKFKFKLFISPIISVAFFLHTVKAHTQVTVLPTIAIKDSIPKAQGEIEVDAVWVEEITAAEGEVKRKVKVACIKEEMINIPTAPILNSKNGVR